MLKTAVKIVNYPVVVVTACQIGLLVIICNVLAHSVRRCKVHGSSGYGSNLSGRDAALYYRGKVGSFEPEYMVFNFSVTLSL